MSPVLRHSSQVAGILNSRLSSLENSCQQLPYLLNRPPCIIIIIAAPPHRLVEAQLHGRRSVTSGMPERLAILQLLQLTVSLSST